MSMKGSFVGLDCLQQPKDNGIKETYTIRIVDSETPMGCWAFKRVWIRAMAFVDMYNALTDKPTLSDLLLRSWVYNSTDVLILAGLDKDEKVVAHLIAQVQYVGSHPYGMVMQVETDEGSADIVGQGWVILQEWIRKKNLKGLANMALNEATMRLWRKNFGFETKGWLMLKTDLGGEGMLDGKTRPLSEGEEASKKIS